MFLISAVEPIFDFVFLVINVPVTIAYDCFDILDAAITQFNFIYVDYLVKSVIFWEMGIYYLSRKIGLFSL